MYKIDDLVIYNGKTYVVWEVYGNELSIVRPDGSDLQYIYYDEAESI